MTTITVKSGGSMSGTSKIKPRIEYLCIKSDMGFIKGLSYHALMQGSLHDSDGDNIHITDEYFDEHFQPLPSEPVNQ